MTDQEQRANLAFADLKSLIIGKMIRTMEYEFSEILLKLKKRIDLSSDEKVKFIACITILESELKNEIKKMEI